MNLKEIPTKADWIVPIAIALASLFVSGWNSYNHNDKVLAERLTAVETHRTDDNEKIDHIQSQVDKLVEWALGHK